MRIRLPLGRSLFFFCAFLFALTALLPLRLALDWLGFDTRGLSAREARGSIWLGALDGARFGTVPLGDLEARLRALPLLVGRARVDIDRASESEPLDGGLTMSRHGFGVDDVTGSLGLAVPAPAPLISFDVADVTIRFRDGRCAEADGTVKASLAGQIGGIDVPGALEGRARCDGGALLLPLADPSGLERVDLRLFADGRYRAGLIVRPSDDMARDRLAAAGFAPAPGGYRLSISGSF